jgi:hypothetical protein
MFFAKKSKRFCVEMGEQTTLAARFVEFEGALLIEEARELAAKDVEGLIEWVKSSDGKGATGLASSICGIYPVKRIVRRQTLDVKRVKEPTYFNEIYTQQFRIEPDKYSLKVLNPTDGSPYDTIKAAQKEAVFCGLPVDDVTEIQDKLLSYGIYPERLELGTLATLGGLVNYLKFKQSKSPVLVLEMGDESTQCYIVSADGVDISRSIASGVASMIPVVQKELGLKDQESATKLFYSNTFDFTSMGGTLVKKLIKELQSLIGFYEVQTGQSIGQVFCTQLPANLSWISATMATALGVPQLNVEMMPWLESLNIKLGERVTPNPPDKGWLGLFSLIASYENAIAVEKK